jgi:DnaJ like chaperone protein
MGYGKWISGALGWALGGPIGGILGFAVGSIFDSQNKIHESGGAGYTAGGFGASEQRNSFLVSLLILSSAVMKADGKIMRSELDYVKRFISDNFGQDAVQQASLFLRDILEKPVDVSSVGAQIRANMNPSARLQLLHFLTGIAQADGMVSREELAVLRQIAAALGIPKADSDSVFAMFDNGADAAYQILEIDKSATDDEVKKAYRRMAVKHHPDKVSNLGSDIQKAAEEKFKKIQQAYDIIKKERGII